MLGFLDRGRPAVSRRHFLARGTNGLGLVALASLLNPRLLGGERAENRGSRGLAGLPHHAPRARRVIFLFQSGGPSQVDLFDPKPEVRKRHGEELPESVRMGQRLTSMTSDQKSKPLTASPFRFRRHGASGAELSELLPYTAQVADDLCLVRTVHTEAINHDPGITFFQTGSQQPGRPSMGAWVSYGLGSEVEDLPAFVVFLSGGVPGDQPLFGRLWGPGFLPSQHQAVKFRGQGDPVLYLSNPPGVSESTRRRMLDGLAALNRLQHDEWGDPETLARIQQYELAFRMQRTLPRVMDLSDEPAETFELYGEDAKQPGTYAANCLLARRLAERGVRFIQLYHRDWDHHTNLPSRIRGKCQQTDQASAALVHDLKRRGLLQDTLVVWAGEFGRTVYCQGDLERDNYGRDHHPRCFTVWLAGGGVRAGQTVGRTDDFSYNIVEDPVHVHDLQATLLHCLGIDHERLTYRFQGRDFRLTDIAGKVVEKLLL
ncbi:MAG: DUF1501 domain-containing protein [Pirellulaceae bacterium]|nr:DUF1501 domain-containing protein [Pirellulaceae bacterium]